ncbi:hypothetical protein HYH03_008815 [Edaphochlamys debaryana]|uniref:Uncharacterized protein n=1 Tax=Edaphochlamys debaryana TaxID=47281 RepID=A0A835XZ56_9CHLO|nr:hypothetical protein HYH03_008815 [Edaphochlamys debaryana]|eukprot:KAG2492901.1 hypothetical protein HYH03_008815 [Edaphochlamys debaryana]
MDDTPHEAAGFTGRYTAGLRYVESSCIPHPLIASDPLAGVLAGERGLELARQELANLQDDQGACKHLRVPARSRLIDDLLAAELGALRAEAHRAAVAAGAAAAAAGEEEADACGIPSPSGGAGDAGSASSFNSLFPPGTAVCQVVSLGAGMCTRPWRLSCLANVAVIELDLPHIAALKQQLLAEAGAGLEHASASGSGGGAPPATYPLRAASYALIGADLSDLDLSGSGSQAAAADPGVAVVPTDSAVAAAGSEGSVAAAAAEVPKALPLPQALAAAGFVPSRPTVWVAEAVLYYMPLKAASALLRLLASLSAPGSRLLATVADHELLEASRSGVPKGHVFADLWHFDTDELLYGSDAFGLGSGPGSGPTWEVDWETTGTSHTPAPNVEGRPHGRPLPPSTRQLAQERLHAQTYVALYGGSELLLAAKLRGASEERIERSEEAGSARPSGTGPGRWLLHSGGGKGLRAAAAEGGDRGTDRDKGKSKGKGEGGKARRGQDEDEVRGERLPPETLTLAVPRRCVVVLGTGRSGSTGLVDAVNQLPGYFVEGEQEGAFYYLYLAWRLLGMAYTHSEDYIKYVHKMDTRGGAEGQRLASHLPLEEVRALYFDTSERKKVPWFNDLHPARMTEAVRAFFAATYGYHGPDVVSGFKEVRFVRGRAFPASATYKDFVGFMAFTRNLCADTKILLNSRRDSTLESNAKLWAMLSRNKVVSSDEETFTADLAATHEWYDEYARRNPHHALRVIMEDMYDVEKNATLARKLVAFLGEDPEAEGRHVSFARLPRWDGSHDTKKRAAATARGETSREYFQI